MKKFFIITILILLPFKAYSDDAVVITMHESDEQYSAQGKGIINAPANVVWEVLNDYNNHAQFMPGAVESRIIETTSNGFIVYKKIKAALREMDYTLRIINYPETLISRYKLVSGKFKKNEGTWKLEAVPDDKTILTYDLEMQLESYTPRWLQKIVYRQMFPGFFSAINKESAKRVKKNR